MNIVGEHATYLIAHDAPLTADIAGIAAPVSDWVGTFESAKDVSSYAAKAITEALTQPGKIATLIMPADVAWNEAHHSGTIPEIPGAHFS